MSVTVGSKNKLNSISGVVKILQLTDSEKTLLADKVLPSGLAITDSNGRFYLTDGTTSIGDLIPVPAIIDENGDNITTTYLKAADALELYQKQESGKGLSANDFTSAYKTKLDGIEAGANKYTLPAATASTIGGVSIPSTETHLAVSAAGALTVNVSDKLDKTANAVSASKLATARTISAAGDATGSTTFDGSANASIALTLTNSGVTSGTYGTNTTKTPGFGGSIVVPSVTTDAKGRITGASDTTITLPAAPTTISGNAGSATKLQTARTIGISGAVTGTATSFDGTSSITIATTSVDGTKVTGIVPKASQDGQGNTISTTYAKKADVYTKEEVDGKVSGAYHFKGSVDTVADLPTVDVVEGDVYNIGASLDGDNYVAHFEGTTLQWDKLGGTIDLSGYLTKTEAATTYLGIGANAVSASKLATARTITVDGDVSGSVSFDGAANKTLSITLGDSGVTAGDYGPTADATASHGSVIVVPQMTVDTKGRVTSVVSRSITMPADQTTITGNAGSATKLQTARTISLSGDATGSASFDGTAAVTIAATLADSGVTADQYGETTDKSVGFGGTISVPSLTVDSKGRVTDATAVTVTLPAAPTTITGNAGSASKLATARAIALSGDVSGSTTFDGSTGVTIAATLANSGATAGTYGETTAKTVSFGGTIAVPKVTVDAKGRVTSIASTTVTMPATPTSVSGNAGTATKLANARTIGISGAVTGTATSFDGSANITITTTSVDGSKVSGAVNQATYTSYEEGATDVARTIPFQRDSLIESTDTFKPCYDSAFTYNPATDTLTVGSVNSANVVKSLSISGRTITATKGDGTTSTISLPSEQTDVSGNAATATKLQTARTIAISGDATGSASFDGSANATISATLASSGVTAGTYGPTTNTTAAHGGTITVPSVTVDAKGRVTSAATRTITMPAEQTSVTGNAGTATKLQTARTIGISGAVTGTAASFDGGANITIAATAVDGTKVTGIVPKASQDGQGNTISTTYAKKADVYTKEEVDGKVSGAYHFRGSVDTVAELPVTDVAEGDVYNIGSSLDGDNYAAHIDDEGNVVWDKLGGTLDLSGYLTKSDAASTYLGISANAASATKLATARTISLSGDATGSASFNGTANSAIAVTLANSGATAGTYGESAAKTVTYGGTVAIPNVTVDSKGRVTSISSTTVTLPAAVTTVSGNAGSATKLATARSILLTGDATGSASFDGTANASITTTLAASGVTAGTYGESAASTKGFGGTISVPKVTVDAKGRVTSASSITVTLPATPTSVSGNAGTATKLATARTIALSGGVTGTATSFDGSSNITIPVTSVDGSKVTGTVPNATNASYRAGTDNAARTIPFNDTAYEPTEDVDATTFQACYDTSFTYNPSTDTMTVGSVNSANVVKGLSISGKTITITKGNGSTVTISLPADQTTITGNAGSATKLQTARTISISGDGTGSASFDGTANAAIAMTLAASGATAGSYGPSANASPAFGGTFSVPYVTVDAKGRTTAISSKTITLPAAPTSVSGNAGTATKLATARTISLAGDATGSASFDGSANASITATLAASGVTAGSYGESKAATKSFGGSISVPYVTIDAKGRVTSASSVAVTLPAAPTSVSGNAGTATKLATARTIGISGAVTGTATSFDGSANITIATTAVDGTKVTGVVPKATADGSGNNIVNTYAKKTDVYTKTEVDSKVAGAYHFKGTVDSVSALPTTGVSEGDIYNIGSDLNGDNYAAHYDSDGNLQWDKLGGTIDLSGYLTKTDAASTYLGINANAASATKLTTARIISLSGDATGSVSFNGTANAAIATTLANSGVTAGTYGPTANATASFGGTVSVPSVTVDAKGRVTSAASRTITMPAAPTSVSGNAGTATKLVTARTISLSGDATGSASFDGSANATIAATLASSGVTAGTYGPTANATMGSASTVSVPAVTVDTKGRVTSAATRTITMPTIDSALSSTSANAVQNKAVYNALAGKMTSTPYCLEFNGVGSDVGYGGYIDFHYNGSSADYTSRIIEDASGKLSITASSGVYINGSKVATASDLSSYLTTSTASSTYLGKTATAASATKLATARTISISGDGTGSASFDGSANAAIAMTLANSGATAGTYGESSASTKSFGGSISVPKVTVDAKGRVTSASSITVTLPSAPTSVSGNAGTATKLATARTISLTGGVTGSGSFDGSANLSIATTATVMTGATSSAAGKAGAVPAPSAGANAKYLRGDGTWQTVDAIVTAMTDAEVIALANTELWGGDVCWNSSSWTQWKNATGHL